jgi:hypothetical protein
MSEENLDEEEALKTIQELLEEHSDFDTSTDDLDEP